MKAKTLAKKLTDKGFPVIGFAESSNMSIEDGVVNLANKYSVSVGPNYFNLVKQVNGSIKFFPLVASIQSLEKQLAVVFKK